jgi:hypothetical protein
MSTTNQHQDDSLLDRSISEAMKLGVHEPHVDFTRELMSVIAEEEAAPVLLRRVNPARLSWTLVALGVVFLIIALLIPTTGESTTSSYSWSGTWMWTIGALGLISLMAMTQSKPRAL